eukprot:2146725-Lingulodinium_polyedra.AAC.1
MRALFAEGAANPPRWLELDAQLEEARQEPSALVLHHGEPEHRPQHQVPLPDLAVARLRSAG